MTTLRLALFFFLFCSSVKAELRNDYLSLPIQKKVVIKELTTSRVIFVETIKLNNGVLEMHDKDKKLTVLSERLVANVIPIYSDEALASLNENQIELLISWINTIPDNVRKENGLELEGLATLVESRRKKKSETAIKSPLEASPQKDSEKDTSNKLTAEQKELHTRLTRWGMAMDDMDELKSYVFYMTEKTSCGPKLKVISNFIIKNYNLLEAGGLSEKTYIESVAFFNECRKGSDIMEYGPAVIPVILNILSKPEYDSQEGFDRMTKDRENNLYLKILHLTLDRYRQYFKEQAS